MSNDEVLEKNGNKKDTYKCHQKEKVEIFRVHNEERWLGKFDTHRTFLKRQRKTAPNLPNEFVQIVGRTGIRRVSKKIKFTQLQK